MDAASDDVARLTGADRPRGGSPVTPARAARNGSPVTGTVVTGTHVTATALTGITRRWSRRRTWGRWSVPPLLAAAVWVAGFVGVVALLASTATRLTTDPGVGSLDSDTATPVLQAQSVLQGHVLLGGWRMLYDSYWTVEVPFYAAGALVTGVDPVLLYVIPAILAVLLLITAALLARERLRGGAAAAAVGAVVALIGLPSDVWAVLLLHGAWHVGTMLWCLLAFAGLRSGRWRGGWWIAVALLAAGLLGDLQAAAYGVGPVAGAGIIAMLRTRRWRAGAPAVSAALASVAAAYLLRKLFVALGAYDIGAINAPATPDQRWANVGNIPSWLARVFGVGTGDWGHNGVPAALTGVRYLAVAAVLVAVLLALWSVLSGIVTGDARRTAADGDADRDARPGGDHWRLDDMLLLACLADIAFYVYAAQSNLSGYLRYLAPFVVFGSILAARAAGRGFAALRPGAVRRSLASAGAVVTVLFAAAFAVTATQPPLPVPDAQLAAFLTAHDQTNGVGTYWPSAMTTVASNGTVTVRPIIMSNGQVVRYGRQSTADWYAGQHFQFLVLDSTDPWGGVTLDAVTAALGRPRAVYQVGTYQVITWPETIQIDPDVFAG